MKRMHCTLLNKQNGAATLLIALVLMMSITVVTLAVARNQLAEEKMAANHQWNTRLSLQAESALALGTETLENTLPILEWEPAAQSAQEQSIWIPDTDTAELQTRVVFSRPDKSARFITIRATARRGDHSGLQAQISQQLRLLSALTPAAEFAPPLVLNGCLTSVASSFHIRPLNADSDQAADAVWLNQQIDCPPFAQVDLHRGTITGKNLGDDLWMKIFSISRGQFETLAAQDRKLPAHQRIYWIAEPSRGTRQPWVRSLGTAAQPVILYFPKQAGCPQLGPGVRLHGLVFIDSDCPDSIGSHGLEIVGSLAVNGNLDVGNAGLQLNHIQVADPGKVQLDLPVLRVVKVPGTWKDF